MGTDIHVMIEHRQRGSLWWRSLTEGEFSFGRYYPLFDALAGAMCGEPMIQPRGIPSDCSAYTIDQHPSDGHSQTWLTPEEFKRILKRVGRRHGKIDDPEINAMLAAAKALEKGGMETRLVIWFDS